MNILNNLRGQMREAEIRWATRHLDNHLLRDIGLPERQQNRQHYRL